MKKIITALGYHVIDNNNFGNSITRDMLEKQVNFLRDKGYKSIDIEDIANHL